MSDIVKDFINAVKSEKKGTTPYDTPATVTRVDGDTAWVHISGGVDETPVKLTVNANVGDTVQLRVGGGKAWITGNATAPPTDDTRANVAHNIALKAEDTASAAQIEAVRAKAAADEAEAAAEEVHGLAQQAQEDAESASSNAQIASVAANTAIDHLSIVEDVVGVLNWISAHGEYSLTEDTKADESKWYFERSGSGTTESPYVYNKVEITDPDTDPSQEGYYELTDVTEAVQDYITAHVALDGRGLWLKNEAQTDSKFLVAADGAYIYGSDGSQIAKYGTEAVLGNEEGFHITISPTNEEIAFWRGSEDVGENKVAYISGDKLYITQSVVLQRMDVGMPVSAGGKGQWTWEVHEINGANNLHLKWLG